MGGREEREEGTEEEREIEMEIVFCMGWQCPPRGSSLKSPGRGTVTGVTWKFAGRALRWTTLERMCPECALYTSTAQTTCLKPRVNTRDSALEYRSLPGLTPSLQNQQSTIFTLFLGLDSLSGGLSYTNCCLNSHIHCGWLWQVSFNLHTPREGFITTQKVRCDNKGKGMIIYLTFTTEEDIIISISQRRKPRFKMVQ